jgi:SARP family transcriptional regulator, regulator of embCAB operon
MATDRSASAGRAGKGSLDAVVGPLLTWSDPGGREFWIDLGRATSPLTVGRRPESGLPVPWDDEVSRVHAQLERVGGDWTVADDGLSRNGTWVNGERITGRRRLFDSDTIRVGTTDLHVAARDGRGSLPTVDAGGDAAPAPGAATSAVQLCGELTVFIGGRRLDGDLPGRQGRLLFAFLVAHRDVPAERGKLADVLWGERPPSNPGRDLSVLLARLRSALGSDVVVARHGHVGLDLGASPHVDVEVARGWAADAARSADAAPERARERARAAADVLARPLLPEFVGEPWVEELTKELDLLLATQLETLASVSMRLGGSELPAAETAARELVRREPYRESGYALLMEACAKQGNTAEALLVYDRLRQLLDEELGGMPSAHVRALHQQLLRQ